MQHRSETATADWTLLSVFGCWLRSLGIAGEAAYCGIIGLAAGFGIFSGAGWARWLGILIASISVIVNFAFIPLAPWWALTLIFIDLWVIHSLFVHRPARLT